MASARRVALVFALASQQTLASLKTRSTRDGPTASFLPDARHLCIEGDTTYIVAYLDTLRKSPLGSHYMQSTIEPLTCLERGYRQGPNPGKCATKSTNWFDGQYHQMPSEETAFLEYGRRTMMMPMQVKMTMLKHCKEVDASTARNLWDHRHKHYTPPKVQSANLMSKGSSMFVGSPMMRGESPTPQATQMPNASPMPNGNQMWGSSNMFGGSHMPAGNQMWGHNMMWR
mmetsp:Transcript_39572/g.89256  ORF Transcript_39572/g.89256 Transcript_39572/m.89256 type:complete len:229 (+) Transcript_39572:80-766(+)